MAPGRSAANTYFSRLAAMRMSSDISVGISDLDRSERDLRSLRDLTSRSKTAIFISSHRAEAVQPSPGRDGRPASQLSFQERQPADCTISRIEREHVRRQSIAAEIVAVSPKASCPDVADRHGPIAGHVSNGAAARGRASQGAGARPGPASDGRPGESRCTGKSQRGCDARFAAGGAFATASSVRSRCSGI